MTEGKRSTAAAVADLDLMAKAVEAEWPSLAKLLRHLRQTGECRLALLGLYGTWWSDHQKQPGRAMVETMSASMSPKEIFQWLGRHPLQFPLSKIPSEKTIRRWLKKDKSSACFDHAPVLISENANDHPPQT